MYTLVEMWSIYWEAYVWVIVLPVNGEIYAYPHDFSDGCVYAAVLNRGLESSSHA